MSKAISTYRPPCAICNRPAAWQIGAFVPLRAVALAYCEVCLPVVWLGAAVRVERERMAGL